MVSSKQQCTIATSFSWVRAIPVFTSGGSSTIAKLGYTFLLGAMVTAKIGAILLKAMTDDSDAAC